MVRANSETAAEVRNTASAAHPHPVDRSATLLADGASTDLSQLLHALQLVRVGDFSVRLPGDQTGLAGKIADTFNEIVAANQRMAQQLERVGQVVGKRRQDAPARQVRPGRAAPGARWRARSTR